MASANGNARMCALILVRMTSNGGRPRASTSLNDTFHLVFQHHETHTGGENEARRTVLHTAVLGRRTEVLELLLQSQEARLTVDHVDVTGSTALHLAAWNGLKQVNHYVRAGYGGFANDETMGSCASDKEVVVCRLSRNFWR